jgi:hypothetical protein
LTVLGSRVGSAAVFNDRGSVQDAHECFKESCLAHKRQRVLVARPSAPDRYFGCHWFSPSTN